MKIVNDLNKESAPRMRSRRITLFKLRRRKADNLIIQYEAMSRSELLNVFLRESEKQYRRYVWIAIINLVIVALWVVLLIITATR